jgi:hypothetical protein
MSVYAVYWPEINVFKVGTSESHRRRWRTFINRGAILLGLKDFKGFSFSDYDFEGVCHDVLSDVCRRGFNTSAEAVPYLGGQGGGWLECYRVPGDLMPSEILDFLDSRLEVLSAQA